MTPASEPCPKVRIIIAPHWLSGSPPTRRQKRSTSWVDIVADHSAKLDALMKKLGLTKGTAGERLRAMYKGLFPLFYRPHRRHAFQ